MTVIFANNFKNILDKLRSVLRDEFKGSMPVYIGQETNNEGTQYLRLDPIGNDLNEYNNLGEIREFEISMLYYFAEPNLNKTSLDHVLRMVSRIEALIHDNLTMTLSDSSRCFNCRIDTTKLNALEQENEYAVELVWRGQHQGNLS